MSFALLFCSLLFGGFFTCFAKEDPCPFNTKECLSTKGSDPDPLIYEAVTCNSTDLPKFAIPSSGKYTVSNIFRIGADVHALPANCFAAFKSIGTLSLAQDPPLGPAPLQWDDKAFDDVQVKAITLVYVVSFMPPPKALVSLGSRGLDSIMALNCSSFELTERVFKGFSSLTSIMFFNTPITRIDDKAFDGLGKLKRIYLQETELTTIDLSVFEGMPSGTDITANLDNNPFLKSVTLSDASIVPDRLKVSIKKTGLETIDFKLGQLLDQKEEVTIDIGNNTHLQCQELAWMAYRVLCSKRISASGAKCADKNNQALAEYLISVDPNVCAVTTTTTTTPAPKGASQVTSWTSLIAMLSVFVIFFKL